MIVNSRPREQAAELSRLLEVAGLEVLEAPAIETVPAWDAAELQAVRGDLDAGSYAWVVLPSQNAGRLLVDELTRARVVCGTATAHALGLMPELRLEQFSASAALDALRPLILPGQRILVPQAAEGRDELTEGLRLLGANIHSPIAYRTVPVAPSRLAAALRAASVSAVTACSPSAIRALLAAVNPDWFARTKLVCLGETTAAAARQAGLRVDGVARKTSMASLVEAVVAVVQRPGVPA